MSNELNNIRIINAVCAIIINNGTIFACQRGYGEWKDWWEFPGGKIEEGESPEEALCREIREELGCEIAVGELLTTIEYDYPTFHLSMHCYWCTLVNSEPHLLEHEDARWLLPADLPTLRWLPADISLIRQLALASN